MKVPSFTQLYQRKFYTVKLLRAFERENNKSASIKLTQKINLILINRKNVTRKGMDPKADSYSGFFDNNHKNPSGLHNLLQSKDIVSIYYLIIPSHHIYLLVIWATDCILIFRFVYNTIEKTYCMWSSSRLLRIVHL